MNFSNSKYFIQIGNLKYKCLGSWINTNDGVGFYIQDNDISRSKKFMEKLEPWQVLWIINEHHEDLVNTKSETHNMIWHSIKDCLEKDFSEFTPGDFIVNLWGVQWNDNLSEYYLDGETTSLRSQFTFKIFEDPNSRDFDSNLDIYGWGFVLEDKYESVIEFIQVILDMK